MANHSTQPWATGMYVYLTTASTEYTIALPVNGWALGLLISSKRSVIEMEILTLNLLLTELLSSLCYFFWLVQFCSQVFFASPLIDFYQGAMSIGRALFQWHLCMDRYLAVIHPIIFMRYKQIRYRGACLAVLWLIVIICGLNHVFFPLNTKMVAISTLCLLFPTLFSEILCSLMIVRILKKSGPSDKETQEKKEGNKMKRKAIKIICLLAIMVVINNLTFILFPLFDRRTYIDYFPVALALSTVGSSVHGLLFLSRVGKLQCK